LARVRRRIEQITLRGFAQFAEIDAGHLSRVLCGERRVRGPLLLKMKRALVVTGGE
jgi:hypothetical protein